MDFFMRNEVIRRLTEMNIEQYGDQKADTIDCGTGIPARVTAVHRSHFEIVCDRGTGLARLKTGEYYGGNENVPAAGDFVLVNWQEGSESLDVYKRQAHGECIQSLSKRGAVFR